MSLYKKGIESKNRIFQVAKRLFYENGYKKTTIEKIAEAAEVPIGLVAYYYKKESLLSQIYQEYMHMVVDCVDSQVGDRLDNHLQKHLLVGQIFYRCLVSDEHNKEIYREIFLQRLIADDIYDMIDRSLVKIVEEFGLSLTPEAFRQMEVSEFGARRELLFRCYDVPDLAQQKDFFYFISTIAARLAGVPVPIIEENIQIADRLLEEIDTSQVKFLV